ncbi:MAG: hypothetical protein CXT73_07205 [Methanobacteriota archaeon]|nr:MAG: hypothetical protein CXT73_07205 [Euryarchaeota archaeon]
MLSLKYIGINIYNSVNPRKTLVLYGDIYFPVSAGIVNESQYSELRPIKGSVFVILVTVIFIIKAIATPIKNINAFISPLKQDNNMKKVDSISEGIIAKIWIALFILNSIYILNI